MLYCVSGIRRGEWGSEEAFWRFVRKYNVRGEFIPFEVERWDGDGEFNSFVDSDREITLADLKKQFPRLEILAVTQSDAA